MNELNKILEEIGLKEHEIAIYLAALELGESTVLPISLKAGVKRTYCYDILSDLEKKGLVSYLEKNNRRRYIAEDPSKIEEILKERMTNFKAVLPDLRAIYNQSPNKPKMRYFEGKEGIISIYENILKSKVKKIDAIASPGEINKVIGDYFLTYIEKMIKNNTEVRELVTHEGRYAEYLSYYKKPLQSARIMAPNVKITTDLMLFDNKLVMISYENDCHAVMIESSSIVETQKALFEIIWGASSKI